MSLSNQAIDRDALRTEIQSAIAAGRELEPSMDGHLADSVIDRYLSSQPKIPQVIESYDDRVSLGDVVLRGAALILSGSIVFALISSHTWWMYWLILPIMGILMAIFGNGSRRQRRRHSNHPSLEAAQGDERRQYEALQQRYKIEKLQAKIEQIQAKRAFISGFSRGFKGTERAR